MEAFLLTVQGEAAEQLVRDVAAHLTERGISKPSDLGFLSRSSGEVSAGLVRLGCPEWWCTSHFDILVRAIRVQAAYRQGVVDLALWELAPPTGGCGTLATAGAPSVVVDALVSSPPSVGPALGGHVPARGGVASTSGAPTVSVSATALLAGSSAEGTCSLGALEKKEMAAAVAFAEAVFVEFGEGTARHRELGRVDGMQELMRQCIRTRCRNARGLRARVRLARLFLCHVRGLGLLLTEIPEHVVASWVNVQRDIARSRGPAAVYAIQWVEQVFGVSLHTSCAFVRAQVASREGTTRIPRPVAAKCPTEEHVCLWERVLASRYVGNFTKSYAGAFCALTHGMLRWSDLQRTCKLHLTPDAVSGIGPMKNQRYLTPWAAPRYGFSGTDWGSQWMEALRASSLPGVDFILLGSNKACTAFTARPATFQQAQQVMRHLLMAEPFCFIKAEAHAFSLHGFRHIYNTAMRQLEMRAEDIDTAGHWKRGSDMSQVYDAADCVKELQTKERVRQAVVAGWRRSEAACLPPPAPVTPAWGGQPAPLTPGVSRFMSAPCTPPQTKEVCPPTVSSASSSDVYVVDLKGQLMHVWTGTTRRSTPSWWTRCKRWRCGTPEAKLPRAAWGFFEKKHFNLCPKCFEISHEA